MNKTVIRTIKIEGKEEWVDRVTLSSLLRKEGDCYEAGSNGKITELSRVEIVDEE